MELRFEISTTRRVVIERCNALDVYGYMALPGGDKMTQEIVEEKVFVVRRPELLALMSFLNEIAPNEDMEEIQIVMKWEDE